ncbi:hypothetical protein KCU92_g1300, partial [Aureobasidium melanogenum]|jgi:hypothetical protein
MEKPGDLENQAARAPPHQPKRSQGMMLRGIAEAIFIVAYLYLRHGRDYFTIIFNKSPLYYLYVVVVIAILLYYLPDCKNGDAIPTCAIKSGTFQSCRCAEKAEEDTVWSQMLDEVSILGAGVLMDEVLFRAYGYLEARSLGL